ncbi:GNAT family N-acetyltransferase [Anaeromicropila herbilytica]|uniref:N-acetyltransferase domain-containing protein n=1 Tax=Anaeromicropila herbilytica TaxID=2785025 RepID=A0A7R7EHZ2_9FIRM|nr:GNAT family N-acetyltransferase [Anaeromicropila herbilytica]BCN29112.1 hypothetical protein bsdtb5_04070 [Anaeromicropila herbilytica]
MQDNIIFLPLKNEDVEELTSIMKRAFDEDTRIHLGQEAGGPPGYDDGSFLRKWGLNPHATAYKIYQDGELIGGTILWINSNKENFLGTIFLDSNVENKGIGTKVWKRIEEMYPDTIAWNTETPIFSRRNHNFYINKCGFHCIRIDKPKDMDEGQFILRKVMMK